MELEEMLGHFDFYHPRVRELYRKGILSPEELAELWEMYLKAKTSALKSIINTASEEHFMQEVREWFLKYTPYGGKRLFFITYGTSYQDWTWIHIYSKNDRVISISKKVAEGLNLPPMEYSVLEQYSLGLDTTNDFNELGRYFLECAANGNFEPTDYALEFAYKNKGVYKEKTILLMLKKYFIDGEDITKLENEFFTRQNYRERVKDSTERLHHERIVNVGNMCLVLPWYGSRGVIFWKKAEDEILVSLAPLETCGKMINAGKYKELVRVTNPMTVEEFFGLYDNDAKETFKWLRSNWEKLDSTMRMVVMLHEL